MREIALSFAREVNECVGNVYCLCRKCWPGKEYIEKVHPVFPESSGGAVDDKAKTEIEARKEITHERIFLRSLQGITIVCWQIVGTFDIDFGKGIWKTR